MANIEINQLSDETSSIFSESSVSSSIDDTQTLNGLIEHRRGRALSDEEANGMIAPSFPGLNSSGPTIDHIGIETSTDVTIGNQTYFQGTVIIKNLVTNESAKFEDTKGKSQVPKPDSANRKFIEVLGLKDKRKRIRVISAFIGLLILIGIAILATVLAIKPSYYDPTNAFTTVSASTTLTPSYSTRSSPIFPMTTTTLEPKTTVAPTDFEVLPYSTWGTEPVWKPNIKNFTTFVHDIFISDTGQYCKTPQTPNDCLCSSKELCWEHAILIENRFKNTSDEIPYNFLIPNMKTIFGVREWVYEGWVSRGGSKGGDEVLFIGMMGSFSNMLVTDLQIQLLWSLIYQGISKGVIHENFKLYAECQAGVYQRPGVTLYRWIQNQMEWSSASIKWPSSKECPREENIAGHSRDTVN